MSRGLGLLRRIIPPVPEEPEERGVGGGYGVPGIKSLKDHRFRAEIPVILVGKTRRLQSVQKMELMGKMTVDSESRIILSGLLQWGRALRKSSPISLEVRRVLKSTAEAVLGQISVVKAASHVTLQRGVAVSSARKAHVGEMGVVADTRSCTLAHQMVRKSVQGVILVDKSIEDVEDIEMVRDLDGI